MRELDLMGSLLVATVPATAGAHRGLDMLTDLALILCVAGITSVLFQRIRQPVVLGYLLTGLIVGPHLPIPLFADEEVAHTLSELGVILLMFSLGLEFSLRKLVKVGPTAGLVAIIQCSLMIWLGYLTARLFGWTPFEGAFTGALIAISSTTIIVKAFSESGITGRLTEIVFGILIVEDLIAILLLAVLTAAASGVGLSAEALGSTLGRLGGFLLGLLVVGLLVVPRLMRLIIRLGRNETTVVASVGICFAFALLAQRFGYSVALGAFLGGALVAESGEGKTIEHLVEPVRDVFAAVFFVSVGMLIDPVLVARNWPAVLLLTVVVILGKVISVSVATFIAGSGVRLSVRAGMSMAQIGEFSFIIAGVGMTLGVTRSFLYPVAVAVSAITTLVTPWLIRLSGPVASYVDRRMPPALQTFATLYGSWVQQLRSAAPQRPASAKIRRLILFLLLDVGFVAAIAIGSSLSLPRLVQWGVELVKLAPSATRVLAVIGTGVLLAPFVLGAVRLARALGLALASEALPPPVQGMDTAAASRRALLVTIQIGILLVVGVPLLAVTQPFISSLPAFAILGAIGLLLAFALWRSATNLQGHVRAGAQVILEALATQTREPVAAALDAEAIKRLIPGLGEATAVVIEPGSACVGRTLRQIDLRGLTGATVIAVERSPNEVLLPTGDETLHAGDVVVLAGAHEAVEEAKRLIAPAAVAS